MKAVILVALACFASALAVPRPESLEVARAAIKNGPIIQGIIPELNQTIVLEDVTLEIDATNLKGVFSLFGGVVTELNSLSDDLSLDILRLTIEGNVLVPLVKLTGRFDILGQILLNSGLHELSGAGDLTVTGTGITAYIHVKLRLTILLKVQISTLTVNPSIVSCEGSAPGARSDGEQVDINQLCVGIDVRLQEEWAVQGPTILADVIEAVNEFLKDLTLQDLIDLITPKP
ncbi:unnamed protein product [Allacma fusca]|uniref:Lipid-binding serum glycoprotein N-terminal domain-containing protein n=1 Tax=Allacma fusca TaxID=39272 RepID=A0A8J2K3R1_9HEXA|nr:unnamed protein product [Allacma fusca]